MTHGKTVTLYLVRHGEIEDTNKLAGHTDFLLSSKGVEQLSQAIKPLNIEHCISSPLSRCQSVAKSFCDEHSISFVTEAAIKECHFGDWDGQAYADLWQLPKPNIGDFWQDPLSVTPPNGESFIDFKYRVLTWWYDFVQSLSVESDNTLIVTHAGVIKLLYADVLGIEQPQSILNKIKVDYASVIKVNVFISDNNQRWVTLEI